jgi:hypothetical protein
MSWAYARGGHGLLELDPSLPCPTLLPFYPSTLLPFYPSTPWGRTTSEMVVFYPFGTPRRTSMIHVMVKVPLRAWHLISGRAKDSKKKKNPDPYGMGYPRGK